LTVVLVHLLQGERKALVLRSADRKKKRWVQESRESVYVGLHSVLVREGRGNENGEMAEKNPGPQNRSMWESQESWHSVKEDFAAQPGESASLGGSEGLGDCLELFEGYLHRGEK